MYNFFPTALDDEESGCGIIALPEKRSKGLQVALEVLEKAKVLLPSFATSNGRKQHVIVKSRLTSTSYMDGLRGVACFCVYFGHVPAAWYPIGRSHDGFLLDGWHTTPDDNSLLQLPLVRLLLSGAFAVHIFFLMSGYVLTVRAIQFMRSRTRESVLDSLSSATFRRAIRLFLPCAVSTFITAFLVNAGIYGAGVIGSEYFTPQHTLWDQLTDWTRIVTHMVNPFHWDHNQPYYNGQLWTIPVEFRCSLVVFLLCLGLARVKPWIRLSILSYVVWQCYTIRFWDVSLFVYGMMLAELSCIRKEGVGEKVLEAVLQRFPEIMADYIERIPPFARTYGLRIFWSAVFLAGLLLGSTPYRYFSRTWGYRWLFDLTPAPYTYSDEGDRTQFWSTIAAMILLTALENCAALHALFLTRTTQYFGRISFSLYIVHIPVSNTLGRWICHAFHGTVMVHNGVSGGIPEESSVLLWMVSTAVVGFLNIWIADVFWRGVDAPCVRFARDVFKWCEDKGESEKEEPAMRAMPLL